MRRKFHFMNAIRYENGCNHIQHFVHGERVSQTVQNEESIQEIYTIILAYIKALYWNSCAVTKEPIKFVRITSPTTGL